MSAQLINFFRMAVAANASVIAENKAAGGKSGRKPLSGGRWVTIDGHPVYVHKSSRAATEASDHAFDASQVAHQSKTRVTHAAAATAHRRAADDHEAAAAKYGGFDAYHSVTAQMHRENAKKHDAIAASLPALQGAEKKSGTSAIKPKPQSDARQLSLPI